MTSPLQPKKLMFLYDSIYYYDKKARKIKINKELDNTYFVESNLIVERLKEYLFIVKEVRVEHAGLQKLEWKLKELKNELERTK